MKEKLKIYDHGERTLFTKLTLYRKEENQFWAKDSLRQLWVKDTVRSEERISRVDTLFGRCISPSHKDQIEVSGQFYPIDWSNPLETCSRAKLRLDSHNGTFEGYILAQPQNNKKLKRNAIYLLEYYLDKNMYIRGWFRMSEISANSIAFDLIRQETLDDKIITIGWSDRVN